jgi:mRNA-degrading endonuclease toxin of MazEF toxin-antitoxin module
VTGRSLRLSSVSVAKRGEVLVARRRLGFASEGKPEHFVVLQSDQLRDLETVLVAPLDRDGPLYEGDPLVVHVSAKEAGTKQPHVVLVYLVTATLLERFESAHVARLSAASMEKVDALLRLTLDV